MKLRVWGRSSCLLKDAVAAMLSTMIRTAHDYAPRRACRWHNNSPYLHHVPRPLTFSTAHTVVGDTLVLAEHDLRVDIGIGARGLRDTSVLVYRKGLLIDWMGTNV